MSGNGFSAETSWPLWSCSPMLTTEPPFSWVLTTRELTIGQGCDAPHLSFLPLPSTHAFSRWFTIYSNAESFLLRSCKSSVSTMHMKYAEVFIGWIIKCKMKAFLYHSHILVPNCLECVFFSWRHSKAKVNLWRSSEMDLGLKSISCCSRGPEFDIKRPYSHKTKLGSPKI